MYFRGKIVAAEKKEIKNPTSWSWERWRSPVWQSLSSHTPSHVDTVQDSLAKVSARLDLSGSLRTELQQTERCQVCPFYQSDNHN